MTLPTPEAESFSTRVERTTRGDIEMITVRGSIDMSSVDSLKRTLSEVASRDCPKVVVICDDVHYINSTGIGALYTCHCDCREAQGGMVLCRPTPKLQKLVSMIGLHQVFVQTENEEEAVAILDPDDLQPGMN